MGMGGGVAGEVLIGMPKQRWGWGGGAGEVLSGMPKQRGVGGGSW